MTEMLQGDAPFLTPGRAQDLDNLYVVDAGFFPSRSSVTPSSTIIAHALRVGDRLLKLLGMLRRELARETATV